MIVHEFKRGPLRDHAERADAAVGGGASKIGEEEMAAIFLVEARSRIVGQPRRAIRHVRNRRHDVRRLTGMSRVPKLLTIPWATVLKVLVVHPPPRVGVLREVHPPRLVAAVRVVVAGEQIAEVIECQLLRIAESGAEDLQLGAVQLTAKDRPLIGHVQLALLGRNRETAIPNGEIKPSVRADDQPVHVMSAKGDSHPEAVVEINPFVRAAVSILVSKLPQFGDAGVEDFAVDRQNTRSRPLFDGIEAVGEDSRFVGLAIAIGVLQQADAVMFDCEFADFITQVLLEKRQPILNRLGRQIVEQPVHVEAVVHDPFLLAKGLGDEDSSLLVKTKGDRVGEQWFGRPQISLHLGWDSKPMNGEFTLIRFLGNFRRVSLGRHQANATSHCDCVREPGQ